MTYRPHNSTVCIAPLDIQRVEAKGLSIAITNNNGKPIYVRIQDKSFRVSDRRPTIRGAKITKPTGD